MSKYRRIGIIGAGGHARVIMDIIESQFAKTICPEIVLFDDAFEIDTQINGYRIFGSICDVLNYTEETGFIIAIGNNYLRKKIAESLSLNYISLIHNSAVISTATTIGKGTVIMPGAVINSGSNVGEHCIINTSATVDHDCTIGNFTHISPGVHLGGDVKIGNCTWLGIGSIVKNGIEVIDDCIVGAGGVVIHKIDEAGIYAGVPVTKIRTK